MIVTLTVIVLTLVGQGLTLPSLIRALRLGTDHRAPRGRGRGARQHLLEAATRRLDELYRVWPGHRPLLDAATPGRTAIARARRSDSAMPRGQRGRPGARRAPGDPANGHRRAERGALLRLRAEDEISDEVLREARARARPRRAPDGRVTLVGCLSGRFTGGGVQPVEHRGFRPVHAHGDAEVPAAAGSRFASLSLPGESSDVHVERAVLVT